MLLRVLLTLLVNLCIFTSALAAPPAAPQSLAAALAALPPAEFAAGSVYLCVGADKIVPVKVPAALLPTGDLDPLDATLMAYGQAPQFFVHVAALAPATMTVLNTSPDLLHLPLSQLAQQEPLSFLVSSLSPAQLQQLAGPGLGFSDLDSDQAALLQAALPHPFKIISADADDRIRQANKERIASLMSLLPNASDDQFQEIIRRRKEERQDYNSQTQTLPDETLRGVRLRADLAARYEVTIPDPEGRHLKGESGALEGKANEGAYRFASLFQPMPPNPLESLLRGTLPNAPKPGDLLPNDDKLAVDVRVDGLKTVGELVARIAKATHLELYCDSHYAGKTLLVFGSVQEPMPARDLIQALALCVRGTWRQVSAAFVLTDDVPGVASRRAYLKEVVTAWNNALTNAEPMMGDHLAALDWLHVLHFAPDDPRALPPDWVQEITAKPDDETAPKKEFSLGDLPGPIQSSLRGDMQHIFQANEQELLQVQSPDEKIEVALDLRYSLIVPNYGSMPLEADGRVETSGTKADAKAPSGKPVALTEKMRAALCAPRTAKEARAIVDKMAGLGFNALFRDVFTNGRTYFPNVALPSPTKEAGETLAAAIDEGGKKGVVVWAVLDTFCWRKDGNLPDPKPFPAGFSEDRTVLGETPSAAIRRRLADHSLDKDAVEEARTDEGARGWVSPVDPNVQKTLTALVKAVAATPGLAGLAFQDTAPPGYVDTGNVDLLDTEVGYTPANRLAFLRAHQADPVDVGGSGESDQPDKIGTSYVFLDWSLPDFPGSEYDGQNAPWDKFRIDADHAALAGLYGAAREAAPNLPLLMRERKMGLSFEPWTGPKDLNEAPDAASETNPLGKPAGPNTLVALTFNADDRKNPAQLADDIRQLRTLVGKPAPFGLLLDLNPSGLDNRPLDELDQIAPFIQRGNQGADRQTPP